ncbi:acyltransferase family protein [Paraburkholderia xenovorans]|uniref:acyltransferase family protein n=1 Tax=Paraburkholderia xenovorans TaxID=36873 RepID=UPI0038BDD8E0
MPYHFKKLLVSGKMGRTMGKNSGIQGLRALAASLVVLQHGIFFACLAKGVDFTPYLPIGLGWIGVSIFFVISGYVMTLCLPQGHMFIVQRIARIYPAYWAAVLLSAASLPLWSRIWSIDTRSLSLLPTTVFNESYGVPYWTLIYEMVFYVVMYAFIMLGVRRTHMAVALTIWGVAIAAVCQSNVHPAFGTDIGAIAAGRWILLSPANFMFIVGALYGLVGQDVFKRTSPLSLAIHAAVLFFISQTLAMPFYVRFLTWGVAYVCVLDLARRIKVPTFLERAGDYSYGLYLVQTILIHCAIGALLVLAPKASLGMYVLIALGTAIIGGIAFGALEFHFHARFVKVALRRPGIQGS